MQVTNEDSLIDSHEDRSVITSILPISSETIHTILSGSITRITAYIKLHIHKITLSITNLPFHTFAFRARTKVETGRISSQKILEERDENTAFSVFVAPGYKIVYGFGEFSAKLYAKMRAVAGKFISGAGNTIICAVMSSPVATFVKWRILSEIDDIEVGVSDDVSLRDLDYIELNNT